MASWREIEAEAPELAPRRAATSTPASTRRWRSVDLRRDPRFALHSASADPPEWDGDAKLAGSAEEIEDPAAWERVYGGEKGDAHLFRDEVTEPVVVRVDDERKHLVIESWHPGRGVERCQRE